MQTRDEQAKDCGQKTVTPQQTHQTGIREDEIRDVQTTQASEGHATGSSLPHKKSARGMSMRRRLGLKIEADEGDGRGKCTGSKASESEAQLRPPGTGEQSGGEQPSAGEEWWKVEYRAPPPGHLGAHAIARDEDHIGKSPLRDGITIDATGRKLEQMEVTAAAQSTASTTFVVTPGGTERSHVHETPERAKKIRGGSDLFDAHTSHSSPNPKRKIMDLQDIEAGTFPSMGIAKELKRFHETNDEHHHAEGDSELARSLRTAVVTPSKLLRPMTKIDIQAGPSSGPSASGSSLEKSASSLSFKAPESA